VSARDLDCEREIYRPHEFHLRQIPSHHALPVFVYYAQLTTDLGYELLIGIYVEPLLVLLAL